MIEKRVKLSLGDIVYFEEGEGKDLIFLHGGFATPAGYSELIELLSKQFRVIAPTHPGHGDSFAVDESYSFENILATYQEFISLLKLNPVSFIGHSMGGSVALGLGGYFPDALLVVMSSPCFPGNVTINNYFDFFINELTAFIKHSPTTKDILDAFSDAQTLFHTYSHHPKTFSALLENLPSFTLENHIQNIKNKTLILQGKLDAIVPYQTGYKLHEMINESQVLTFENEGHVYSVIRPETTYYEIEKFFVSEGLIKHK